MLASLVKAIPWPMLRDVFCVRAWSHLCESMANVTGVYW